MPVLGISDALIFLYIDEDKVFDYFKMLTVLGFRREFRVLAFIFVHYYRHFRDLLLTSTNTFMWTPAGLFTGH